MSNTASAPWLSVVMPSQRGERWIDLALGSIADGPAAGIEVVLVDGGPTRKAVQIADRYRGRLALRIFERPDLASWHAKTNFGVREARASHVCWLGVDDVWLAGRALAARAWIDAAPAACLHFGASAIIDRRGRRLGRWRCPLPPDAPLPPQFVTARLLVQNFVAAPAPVFRRDAWLSCGGLDSALWYTADWDVWLKLVARGPVLYHDAVTIGFRIHGDSLTMTGRHDVADFTDQMQRVLERHLPSLGAEAGAVERAARVSIAVNAALASAGSGNLRGLLAAAGGLCRLGPAGLRRYFRDSRIADRLMPRLRAAGSGGLR